MSSIQKTKKQLYRMVQIRLMVLVGVISFLFMPNFGQRVAEESNFFLVYLDGQQVGAVEDKAIVQPLLARARANIAKNSDKLVYAEGELEIQEKKVVFGRIDSKSSIVERMTEVLTDNIIHTLKHAYTVKINNYTVNLASTEEVLEVLNAAIHKYDTEGKYKVTLSLDPERELNVLAASVEESGTEEKTETVAFPVAGYGAYEADIFQNMNPEYEKAFEDYDYGLMSMDFGDTVEIVDAYVMDDEITPLETAISQVTDEQDVNVIYEVQAGDTLSQIAEKVNIPMDKIVSLNANLTDMNSTIRIGDELIVTELEPALSIERQEQQYFEEDYEADIIYIDNDSWYTTQEVTLQEPSAGHRNAVVLLSYRNNKETNREIIKEEVVLEAIPKIVEKGTKIPPTYIKPISGGRLSSGFGGRRAPTKGASTNHKGIDWAVPKGTAVVASSGGTVTKAGWGSGYGYVVYIKHPDGRETRYGHLSKVLVSSGQSVKQGQKIALSGNTGRSTGPHLHFEIRINGAAVNPLKYLN